MTLKFYMTPEAVKTLNTYCDRCGIRPTAFIYRCIEYLHQSFIKGCLPEPYGTLPKNRTEKLSIGWDDLHKNMMSDILSVYGEDTTSKTRVIMTALKNFHSEVLEDHKCTITK